MRRIFSILLACLLPTISVAQDQTGQLTLGTDSFLAGETVTQTDSSVDDLFMAGETITLSQGIGGSAHLAGRRISIDGAVGADLYVAGMDVFLRAPVAGDVTAAGYNLDLDGIIGGDLRLSGANLRIGKRVDGTAIVAGDILVFDGSVTGDMILAARSVTFGPEARIEGRLTLYEEVPGTLDIPDRVIAADRVQREGIEDWDHGPMPGGGVGARAILVAYLGGVVMLTALAALLAALLPNHLADLRQRLLADPLSMLGTGFVSVSAMAGAGIVLGLTLIGLILTPATFLLAFLIGLVGYVVAVYALGVRLMVAFGRDIPDALGARILAALMGSALAAAVALVPFVGWLFVLALGLAGAGAIIAAALRPKLFAA